MEKIYDVIVIGAGPGGISAAIYAKRSNLDVLLVEKGIPGGQLNQTNDVENYPGYDKISGENLANKMFESVKHLDIEYKRVVIKDVVKEDGIFKLATRKGELLAKSIIIASGSNPKKLQVTGENELAGRGVSYCAICDGNFFKNKDVVVIGGGDAALEETAYLANIAKSVTIVHRRNEFRAKPHILKSLKQYDNVSLKTPFICEEIIGTNSVEKLKLKNVETNQEEIFETNGVFIYVGMAPNSNFLENLGVSNEEGWIPTNEHMHTNLEGCFAIGDIRLREKRQIVFATNDGAIAALEAYNYLSELKIK